MDGVVRQLVPALSSVELRLLELAAKRRQRELLLALLQYRLQKGQFPPTLAVFSLPKTEDPFTNQPMTYKKRPKVLCCIAQGSWRCLLRPWGT